MKKTILTIVEGIVLGLLAFGFGNYYVNISKSSDVKWELTKFQCTNAPVCDAGRITITIYKLGGNAESRVRMIYALYDPGAGQIVKASVERYEVSLLNYLFDPTLSQANGQFASLPVDDPEINPKTAVDFTLDQLEAGQAYRLNITIQSKASAPEPNGGFQIRNANYQRIDYEGLHGRDYVRLYLVEAIVLTAVALLVLTGLTIGLTWRGRAFVAPALGIFRRK